MPEDAGVQHRRGMETCSRDRDLKDNTTLLTTHPLFAFPPNRKALPFASSTDSRSCYLQLLSFLQLDELLLKPVAPRGRPRPPGMGTQSRSPWHFPPSTGCPDPSSSSLQSRRSIASQLIASTHVCKLTVYWKMPRNVNFIRNWVIAKHFHFFIIGNE